jgi:hypothetical protein
MDRLKDTCVSTPIEDSLKEGLKSILSVSPSHTVSIIEKLHFIEKKHWILHKIYHDIWRAEVDLLSRANNNQVVTLYHVCKLSEHKRILQYGEYRVHLTRFQHG